MNIPGYIHVIWLGTPIPNSMEYPYRRRILEWKQHNPNWEVIVWSNLEHENWARLQKWCQDNSIHLCSLEQVQWGTEKSLVLSEIERRFYLNASHLLRMRILYQLGGLYVDLDVEPQSVQNFPILHLGIGLLFKQAGKRVDDISMKAMASCAGHELLQLALWIGEQNYQLLSQFPDWDERKADDVNVRRGATMALTGGLLLSALGQVVGVFPRDSYAWTISVVWMNLAIGLQYSEKPVDVSYSVEMLSLIEKQNQLRKEKPLTSILHWAAIFGHSEIIRQIGAVIVPFESYFGFSPRGMALRYQRPAEIVELIPPV